MCINYTHFLMKLKWKVFSNSGLLIQTFPGIRAEFIFKVLPLKKYSLWPPGPQHPLFSSVDPFPLQITCNIDPAKVFQA